MSPPLGLHLAAMRFAMREAALAADLLLLRVWCRYLIVRGLVSAWRMIPACNRPPRADFGASPIDMSASRRTEICGAAWVVR